MHTEPVVVERHRRTGHVSDMLWMMMMMTMTVNENHSSWRIFHCDWIGAVNVTTMVVTTAVNIVYLCVGQRTSAVTLPTQFTHIS